MVDFFPFFKKIGFRGILGSPSYGIGATICIGREMLCLPYAGFFLLQFRGGGGPAKPYLRNCPSLKQKSGLGHNLFSSIGRVFQTNYHPQLGNAPGNKQHSKTPAVLPSTIRAIAGTPQHGKISLKPRLESKITIPSRSNKRQLSTRGKYHLISCGTPSYGNTGHTWQRRSYVQRSANR